MTLVRGPPLPLRPVPGFRFAPYIVPTGIGIILNALSNPDNNPYPLLYANNNETNMTLIPFSWPQIFLPKLVFSMSGRKPPDADPPIKFSLAMVWAFFVLLSEGPRTFPSKSSVYDVDL